MKFISLTGPTDDIDRVVNTYLSKYEIHLENALAEWNSSNDLMPYVEANPYKEMLAKASSLVAYLPDKNKSKSIEMNVDTANSHVSKITENIDSIQSEMQDVRKKMEQVQKDYDNISPFIDLKCDISAITDFKHIRYKFGKIPKDYFQNFRQFCSNNPSIIYIKCKEDAENVWILYFVSQIEREKIDATCTSFHFEETFIPQESKGTPEKVCSSLLETIDKYKSEINRLKDKLEEEVLEDKDIILNAYNRIHMAYDNFDVRKLAAKTTAEVTTFYIICGWISVRDAEALSSELDDDNNVICIFEDAMEHQNKKPPTKLKNPKVIKPFEMYIKMYGLPAYNEFDPTIFVAITYSFIFGIMFGDVGQGLCLVLGGFALYKLKKMDLAAIISCAGVFSTLFGFMFGSVFGFEDILEPLWLRPAEKITSLPMVGSLNTIFIFAIVFGMFLILLAMIFNIINCIVSKDITGSIFDTNGIAGFVFYGSAVLTIMLFMTGHSLPGTIVLIVMFIIPLILIAIKEPVTHALKKKEKLIEGSVGMFLVQTFFELFEVLLSYFSNTLSFVRVGAFAVSHAAMMEVVMMLAGAESGSPNIVVVILGNLFVMGMEGLIVGIQVLRLEFYEMFSRFYSGTGREFKPFRNTNN